MKRYCFQLSTGLIFKTTQEVVYTSKGYCIDKQCIDSEDSSIDGSLHLPNSSPVDIKDMMFRSKDIVAEWIEE